MEENRGLLKVDPAELQLEETKSFGGITHFLYRQVHGGIPVETAAVKLHVTEAGEVIGFQSRFEPQFDVPLQPSITELSALAAVSADTGRAVSAKGELALFPDERDGKIYLAWKFKVRNTGGSDPGLWYYFVDAHSGRVLYRYNDLRFACPGSSGTVSGLVFPVSPDLSLAAQGAVQRPIVNQFVWRVNNASSTVSAADGTYCFGAPGKIFASLKGPYFSVSNAWARSAHHDNGGGVWRTDSSASAASPQPYQPSQTYTAAVTVNPVLNPGETFAKAAPFFSRFDVGAMDIDGTITEPDEVSVLFPDGTAAGGT